MSLDICGSILTIFQVKALVKQCVSIDRIERKAASSRLRLNFRFIERESNHERAR